VIQSHSVRAALKVYEWLWRAVTPLLCRNHRLQEGLPQRLGQPFPTGPFDIWIQAASAGESHLAGQILEQMGMHAPHRILLTTNTRQGKDTLDATAKRMKIQTMPAYWKTAYFPFDQPSRMKKAVESIQPRVMVLLETEIWPGLMDALKTAGIPIIIVNARMQSKSLRQYQLWSTFWHAMAPDRVLAVSPEDADRYGRLYGATHVSVMPNMKFDRIRANMASDQINPVMNLMPPDIPFIVLGSIRKEEEDAVDRMIRYLLDRRPDILIGLFPRHMHRIPTWQNRLNSAGITCHLRSHLASGVNAKSVILWDVFGELTDAYAQAAGVFVGGTLAPLGGQNFLEPLTCGMIPIIGPSWKTFNWVGRELFEKGLVRVATNWRNAADALLETMTVSPSREDVLLALDGYLAKRQGGTAVAVRAIEKLFSDHRSVAKRRRHC
jgi:3-deoxy-D-manno-octulosonic-acid transferase